MLLPGVPDAVYLLIGGLVLGIVLALTWDPPKPQTAERSGWVLCREDPYCWYRHADVTAFLNDPGYEVRFDDPYGDER